MKTPKQPRHSKEGSKPAFLFDLDGTLVDSVFEHVMAWKQAFAKQGLSVPGWRIRDKIGMSGDLLMHQVLVETGQRATPRKMKDIEASHKTHFMRMIPRTEPLAGTQALLDRLTSLDVRWAIGTGGDRRAVTALLKALRIPDSVPIVTGDDVTQAKPRPDIFVLSSERLGVPIHNTVIVGDSVWDLLAARRAKALSIGLRCGGTCASELERAGAYRVYDDPADLLKHLAELGLPSAD